MTSSIAAKILKEETGRNNRMRMTMNFPLRMYHLITDAKKLGVDDVISWHSSGEKFLIINQKDFTTRVLPIIFKQSKFSSFRRQLNGYGFERESTDPTDSVTFAIFSHKSFRRGDPQACAAIKRRRGSGFITKSASSSPIDNSAAEAVAAAATAKIAAVEKRAALKKANHSAVPVTTISTDPPPQKPVNDDLMKLANAARESQVFPKSLPYTSPYSGSALMKLVELQELQRKLSLQSLYNSNASPLSTLPSITQLSAALEVNRQRETLDRALTLDRVLQLSGYRLVKL
eukprot:CAMPEP_0194200262 /NCGR_PEP_ID=MMETSP0156-20130528/944_1 /TAXON_ID=33649 /ORGANISM="Thalassionema nitzschioides, Strain L26-B" /LENGTH=287 /DNA_ID=CAMNT_0038925237 /DNA_START=14 /DNA_END=877 /DNA_ORIENTATION=-